jgi:gluconolactonase
MEQDGCYVYRVDPKSGKVAVVADDFAKPNGLAFSPDESILYVGDSGDLVIRRFTVASNGSISGGGILVDMREDGRRGVPDGMKVDEDGRLWTTGAGGVWVVTPEGERLGVFEMEEHAANLTFGGDRYTSLFLAASTSVYRVETNVRGIAPGSR